MVYFMFLEIPILFFICFFSITMFDNLFFLSEREKGTHKSKKISIKHNPLNLQQHSAFTIPERS